MIYLKITDLIDLYNLSFCILRMSVYIVVVNRLGARVAYRSRGSGLGPGIGSSRANFYPVGSGVG